MRTSLTLAALASLLPQMVQGDEFTALGKTERAILIPVVAVGVLVAIIAGASFFYFCCRGGLAARGRIPAHAEAPTLQPLITTLGREILESPRPVDGVAIQSVPEGYQAPKI